MRTKVILFIGVVLLLVEIFIYQKKMMSLENRAPVNTDLIKPPQSAATTVPIIIKEGKTFSVIMKDAGISQNTIQEIFEKAKPLYDLSSIKAGRILSLTFHQGSNEIFELMYQISDDEELYVRKNTSTSTPEEWSAMREKIPYEIQLKTVQGTINDSLYIDGLQLHIPEGTLIEFAEIFEYAIDYAYDIQKDDMFTFVYEERYRDGAYIMPGKILTGKFTSGGKTLYAYYFEESENNKGYFDEKAIAHQKMFLRTPVSFKYISSGFTTGLRYVAAFNVSTGHRAIDYAAASGTPVRSVGDGTVTFAGWSKAGYGYLTSIRHNNNYSTNYAHQSKIIVKRGQRVRQGQTIGYVGSTGFSTGPHLHYEMVKNGVKINPLKEVLPPGKPLKEENKARFFEGIEKYNGMLE